MVLNPLTTRAIWPAVGTDDVITPDRYLANEGMKEPEGHHRA
jgi:hypothetical protein